MPLCLTASLIQITAILSTKQSYFPAILFHEQVQSNTNYIASELSSSPLPFDKYQASENVSHLENLHKSNFEKNPICGVNPVRVSVRVRVKRSQGKGGREACVKYGARAAAESVAVSRESRPPPASAG
jgi:hypothetical protein